MSNGESTQAGCSSVAQEVFNDTEELLQKAIQKYKDGKLVEAGNSLTEVLEARAQHFGEFAIECAEAHYYYGVSLFELSKENSDVFGSSSIAEKIQSFGEGPSEATEEEAASSVQNADNSASAAGSDDDLAMAWNALEVAKRCYEQSGEEKHRKQLADVHCALADISIEQSQGEVAFVDYEKAIELLMEDEVVDDQRLSEVHFRYSIGLELEEKYADAKEKCQKSIIFLKRKIETMQTAEESAAYTDLQEVVKSLEERMIELEEAIKSKDEVKKMVMTMFQQGLAAPAALANASTGDAAKDLGTVGRGKGRITLEPVKTEAAKDDKAVTIDIQARSEKRRLEDDNTRNPSQIPKKARVTPEKID